MARQIGGIRGMRCPSCSSENPQGTKFCIDCTAPLGNRCPKCGFENISRARFCGQCAAALTEPTNPSRNSAPSAPFEQPSADVNLTSDGERKTITALFADIKGSMELMEDLDPEEARHIIDPALKLMMEAVHRYEGYVAQSLGDGILALFGAPIAHEDPAQRALYAALRMQEESRRFAEKLRLEKGTNVKIRVGINTGECG